ncbi:uncharacterized protein LOC114744319 [Neltuma alba]|uniref:uncharacterized protein LOC114744319 n=1 Tax=Neltuma alba TaxID=207710 RepID=UPI0010A4EBCE|nr:uncharacterized protein LOC114744319 [Prosopis alba]
MCVRLKGPGKSYSSLYAGSFGVTGVLKKSSGSIIEGFQSKLPRGDALSAEIWGCLLGLKRAWDCGLRNVRLSSDSQEALGLFLTEPSDLHEDLNLILEVRDMLQRDWKVDLHYFPREENNTADILRALAMSVAMQILSPGAVMRYVQEDTGG